ncbi:MAG: hypothetical protein M3Y64_01140 [Gemmatimonadota bacterium]|nr:hypothetical protein [Gemmatimonadota bacterium]
MLQTDSTYASPRLRELVQLLSRDARTIPTALRGYHARVESEIAAVVRIAGSESGVTATIGDAKSVSEHVMQVEQVASILTWQRDGVLEQHVVGHRYRSLGASISALSYFRRPWVVPVLYGNRLQMLFSQVATVASDTGGEVASAKTQAAARSVPLAVHPFADDRERYYQFAGGDTASILHIGPRAIPILRIVVTPRRGAHGELLLFRGEVDVDAIRHQVVRLHGQFVIQRAEPSVLRRVIAIGIETVAFADFVNGEFDGQFWLPTEQRIEAQVRSRFASESRPILRVTSRFSNYHIDEDASVVSRTDSTPRPMAAALLSVASNDSLNAFSQWGLEIGRATSEARAEDFDDVAPESWRPAGAPRFDLHAENLNDVVRFDRVEGLFLGVAGVMRFRDAVPGLEAGMNVGYAFTERTARGALWTRWTKPRTAVAVRADRALATTNDFLPLLDAGPSVSALLASVDDYDYVDRRQLRVSVAHALALRGTPQLLVEFGVGNDRSERRRLRSGIFQFDTAFRANRPVAPGGYLRSAASLQVHPNVSGEFLEPGIGLSLWYERGDGTLNWQRVEGRVALRHTRGALSYSGRFVAAAVVTRQVLPQQILEFGENEGLQGYSYKEFGGDRAVLGGGGVAYQLPFLRAPIRLGKWSKWLSKIYFPGVAPSLEVGVEGGWSVALAQSTRSALAQFGTRFDALASSTVPATRPTSGARSTASATFSVFGGALGIGIAHPLDRVGRASPWRVTLGGGHGF